MVLSKSMIRQAYLKPELRASILAGLGRVASSDDGPDPGGAVDLIQAVVGIISDRFDGAAQEVHGGEERADAVFKVEDDHESGFEIEVRSSGDRYDLTLYRCSYHDHGWSYLTTRAHLGLSDQRSLPSSLRLRSYSRSSTRHQT